MYFVRNLILLIAVAIAVLPKILFDSLPEGLSLDFDKPTTLIVTGANGGLGLATVQNFAHNENATIIMACRNMERCESAKQQVYDSMGMDIVKADLKPMMVDLSQKSSMEAFANALQKNQPIDIVIHNAGLSGPLEDLSYHEENGVELHTKVNHLGPFYLTHLLWKNLLLAEQGARIVLVASFLPSASPTFGWYEGEERFTWSWNLRQYGCSKRANLFFANELHHRYYYEDSTTNSRISVTAAHPGFSHTNLCKEGCKGQETRFLSNTNLLTGTFKMTPEQGSLSQSYAAVVPESNVYLGPSLFLVGKPKILGTLDGSWHHQSFTREESKVLWDMSMKAMGIKEFGDYQQVIPQVETKDEPKERVVVDAEAGEEATSIDNGGTAEAEANGGDGQ